MIREDRKLLIIMSMIAGVLMIVTTGFSVAAWYRMRVPRQVLKKLGEVDEKVDRLEIDVSKLKHVRAEP